MRLGGDGYATEDLSQERLNNLEQGQAVPERREGFLREHNRAPKHTDTRFRSAGYLFNVENRMGSTRAPACRVWRPRRTHSRVFYNDRHVEISRALFRWARRRPVQPRRLRSPDAGRVPL